MKKDLARVTDVEGYDAQLAPGVRALRGRVGDAASVQALAEKLEGTLAAGGAIGGGAAKSLLLRFTLLGVVGLGIGAGLWAMREREPAPRYEVVQEVRTEIAPTPVMLPEAKPAAVAKPEIAAQPAARVRAKKLQESPRSAANDPEAELALLGRAQTLLSTDPRASLTLLDQHVQSYPKGVFREEREVLALEAENKLGRKAAAVARAERFVAAFPRSAHVRRVRALLEPVP